MIFPNVYKALSKNIFKSQEYQIVPIRYKDRLNIMKWRNEQIYHLRQSELLTILSHKDIFKILYLNYSTKKNLTNCYFHNYHLLMIKLSEWWISSHIIGLIKMLKFLSLWILYEEKMFL